MKEQNRKPNHETIYNEQAAMYDLLVSREDAHGNLSRALLEGFDWAHKDVVELGAGTGRLSLMLAPLVGSLAILDASAAMLEVASQKLTEGGFRHWRAAVADHLRLPVDTASADAVIGGWTVCYVASSNVDGWERNLEAAVSEMMRVVRPGGNVVLIETLGTGTSEPAPPGFLVPYFRTLEEKYGFTRQFIRTDFQFQSPDEAAALVRFFFGDKLADRVQSERTSYVPSCTGIWHMRKQ